MSRCLLFLLCVLAAFTLGQPALAEIYRWTDEEGKVHYSDRKLAENAEDITARTRVQNIDSSQEELRKMQQIFRPENDADREYRRQQLEAQKPSAELRAQCRKLRTHLQRMSGRVQIVNAQGKEVRFTETERQQHLAETQNIINERCARVP